MFANVCFIFTSRSDKLGIAIPAPTPNGLTTHQQPYLDSIFC